MKEHHPPARMKSRISRSNALIAVNVLHESRALDDITKRDMVPINVCFQIAFSNGIIELQVLVILKGSVNLKMKSSTQYLAKQQDPMHTTIRRDLPKQFLLPLLPLYMTDWVRLRPLIQFPHVIIPLFVTVLLHRCMDLLQAVLMLWYVQKGKTVDGSARGDMAAIQEIKIWLPQ
jgi:hypothetical protein